MGLRENPTRRQKRLGQELKRLRDLAGLSAAEAGELIGIGRAHMSHIEAGRTYVSEENVRVLTEAYGCTRTELVEGLVSLATTTGSGWWSEYKRLLSTQLLDLAELEAAATGYRTFQWLYVPGLLQTREYTHALIQSSGNAGISTDLLDRYREFRQRRQQVLKGEGAPAMHAIIHEGAFHMGFIDRGIMAEQLCYLVEASRSPNVTVQILPFSTSTNPAALGAFTILDARAPELRTVYVEQPITSVFLSDHDQVDRYAAHFARLSQVALAPLDPEGPSGEGTFGLVQYLLYALKEGKRVQP